MSEWAGFTMRAEPVPLPHDLKEGDRILIRPTEGEPFTVIVENVEPAEDGLSANVTVTSRPLDGETFYYGGPA